MTSGSRAGAADARTPRAAPALGRARDWTRGRARYQARDAWGGRGRGGVSRDGIRRARQAGAGRAGITDPAGGPGSLGVEGRRGSGRVGPRASAHRREGSGRRRRRASGPGRAPAPAVPAADGRPAAPAARVEGPVGMRRRSRAGRGGGGAAGRRGGARPAADRPAIPWRDGGDAAQPRPAPLPRRGDPPLSALTAGRLLYPGQPAGRAAGPRTSRAHMAVGKRGWAAGSAAAAAAAAAASHVEPLRGRGVSGGCRSTQIGGGSGAPACLGFALRECEASRCGVRLRGAAN